MFKAGDFIIAVPMLGVVIASFFLAYSSAGDNGAINVKGEQGEWVFPADAVETLVVSGPLGDTVVDIARAGARITASPCLNQSCVAAGVVHPGRWAACLPNRVMLYVSEGENVNNVDAAAW
ncbi:MAG: NusG domain II-containing protein [Treponema sp.]|nr:NusG domain II-containing protein [Treponema sp.]